MTLASAPVTITVYVVLAVTLGLLAYNVVMGMNKTVGDRIGDVVIQVAKDNPLLVFAAGVLYGHLFFN